MEAPCSHHAVCGANPRQTPIYQLFDKELWEDFTFKERYAGWQELRRYFDHVEKKWDVKKDTQFNKHVDGAVFDEQKQEWLVECSDGSETRCRWFLPCIGFAAKRYTPPVPGLSNFRGDTYHTYVHYPVSSYEHSGIPADLATICSAVWPQHGVNFKGKRVAQIGTGASGIQVIQEIGDKTKHLTVFQRTPNFCLPMKCVNPCLAGDFY